MASYRVAEYAGPSIAGHPAFVAANFPGFIRGQSATSTTAVTALTLSSGTRWVMLECDSGMVVAYGSSTASAPAFPMTSTQGQVIPPNAVAGPFAVQPYQQLFVAST